MSFAQKKMTARYFAKYEFEAKTIIDVGVSRGTPFLYDSMPDRKFVLIDPLSESRDQVARLYGSKIDYDFHELVVSDHTGKTTIAIPDGRQALTSVGERLRPDMVAEEREVEVRKLDDIALAYPGPFGLKIDTEGHELKVLDGSVETLKSCEFVILETSIKRRFRDGYRFSEAVAKMAEHGFEVYAFLSGLSRSPRMSDLLFVPWNSTRFDMKPK